MELLEIHVYTNKEGFEIKEVSRNVHVKKDSYYDSYGMHIIDCEDLMYNCTDGEIVDKAPVLRNYTYCLPKDKDKAIQILKDSIINRADELIQGAKYLQNSITGKTIYKD